MSFITAVVRVNLGQQRLIYPINLQFNGWICFASVDRHRCTRAGPCRLGIPKTGAYGYLPRLAQGDNGAWSASENVSNDPNNSTNPQLSTDSFGSVHLTWSDDRSGNYDIFYREQSASGVWSAPINLTIAKQGDLCSCSPRSIWRRACRLDRIPDPTFTPLIFRYRYRDEGARWSAVQNIFPNQAAYPTLYDLIVDQAGRANLLWQGSTTLYISRQELDGTWDNPETVYISSGSPFGHLYADANGKIFLLIVEGSSLRYRQLSVDGIWSNVINLSTAMQATRDVEFQVHPSGLVHSTYETQVSGRLSPYYSRLVVSDAAEYSSLSQHITLPAGIGLTRVIALYKFSGGEPQPGSKFVVTIDNGSVSSEVFSTAAYTNNWVHYWVDLSPWAGQTVTISFDLQQAAGMPFAWALLDDVTVGASRPDLWLYKNAVSPAVIPGQNAVFTLTYGNQGGASVASVRITDTLPAELTFVSASPAPVTTTPSLVWDLPGLPASSGPFTIQLTTTLTSTVPALSKVENHATIEPVTGELERMNNFSTEIAGCRSAFVLPNHSIALKDKKLGRCDASPLLFFILSLFSSSQWFYLYRMHIPFHRYAHRLTPAPPPCAPSSHPTLPPYTLPGIAI